MKHAMTRIRSKSQSLRREINAALVCDRGMTTAEMSWLLLGLIALAALFVWGLNAAVENNIANIPDHTNLP